MKVIIAPDKFKGSLTSFEVCNAIAAGIKEVNKNAEVIPFPMADGGDGFAAVMSHYLHTEKINCETVDPLGKKMNASYQWDKNTKTAIIELASASGLVLLKTEERNPLYTSTYGTGLLIKDAITKGAQKILLGLGGSSTNDAGTGILTALGFRLKDKDGNDLIASGENLQRINEIITPAVLSEIKFEIACDVQNVLYGTNGAAAVYGPQKGANAAAVEIMDNGLRNFAEVLLKITGKKISDIPGTGAAGGIAASLLCYFDTTLVKGIEVVMEASKIQTALEGTTVIITGEGKIDGQTLEGKVVSEIAKLAHNQQIPVIAFCGLLDASVLDLNQLKLTAAQGLVSESVSTEEAMTNAETLLIKKVTDFFSTRVF